MSSTFVIGDVHGHLDRLEALLRQEGIIGDCPDCDGSGDIDLEDCPRCEGLGIARIDHNTLVVQLGDLGHFGEKSPTADILCYKYGQDWIDIFLWGNHDRALVDRAHAFRGYIPNHEALHIIRSLMAEGRYKLAHSAHGFLLTHAGLAFSFRDNDVDLELKSNPEAFADWINEASDPEVGCSPDQMGVRDSIGAVRGGSGTGGILWRDVREKLYPFRQVFGHSSGDGIRYCDKRSYTTKPEKVKMPYQGWSYCIDIGNADNGRLAGIWLPSERIVEVQIQNSV